MSEECKNKIINLNHLGSTDTSIEKGFLREDKLKSVIKMIDQRVDQVNLFKGNSEEEFKSLRGHDTILIDGQRGSGKTTFLTSISKQAEESTSKVYMFDIIDPTLISISKNDARTNSDILLMIVSRMYALVIDEIKKGYTTDEYQVQTILKKIKHINNTIINGYDVQEDMDYQERMYSLNDGLKLDLELHYLFKLICTFIDKDMLILPIDDIDMEIDIAFEIFDVIRRYMSSPRIIIIVAVNSSQAYGLVKKHFFDTFNLKTDDPIGSISPNSDLDFIKSLPRAYMLKSFLPSRRIEMDDMYTLYEYYNRMNDDSDKGGGGQESKTYTLTFTYTNRNDISFRLDSKVLLKAFVNTVYGVCREYNANTVASELADYLESLSMRSFISDVRNFLEAITQTKDGQYVIDKQSFKDHILLRFLDYPRRHNRKESALINIWEEFIHDANAENTEGYYGDIINRTLHVDGYNVYNRYPKTYHRLWLQTYYMKSLSIQSTQKEKCIIDIGIKKKLDIMGVLEFALRSFIPMHIVQRHLQKHNTQLTPSQMVLLKSLGNKPLQELSSSIASLERKLNEQKHGKDIKYLGRVNNLDEGIKEPYEVIMYDWYSTVEVSFQHSSMSFFKSLVFFIDFSRFLSKNNIYKETKNLDKKKYENKIIRKFFFNYLPIGYKIDPEIEEKLCTESRMSSKLFSPELEAYNTSFDLMSISSFSQRVVENFLNLFNGIQKDQKKKEGTEEKAVKSKYNKYYFSMYISSFLNALLIEFMESLEQDIPLNKSYIHLNPNWEYKENYSSDSSVICPSSYNTLLFDNLISIQKYFQEELSETRDAIFSIVMFVIHAMKYCGVWSNVLKEVYGYQDIFIDKTRDENNHIKEFKIFMVHDEQVCKDFNDKIRAKHDELVNKNSDNVKNRNIFLDKYCHDEIFKNITISK